MKRILLILPNLDMGGTEAVVMNYLRAGVPFDFVVHGDIGYHEAEARALGAKLFRVPTRSEGFFANIRAMRQLYKTHPQYDTVLLCTEHAFGFIELAVAWGCRVKYRGAWSHFSNYQGGARLKKILHYPARPWLRLFTNYRLACTAAAGQWLFGCNHKSLSTWFPTGGSMINTNFDLVKNAINLQNFAFDAATRHTVRERLQVGNRLAVGIVGRLNAVKNHTFALRVFAQIQAHALAADKQPMLYIIGDGTLRASLETQANELGISNNVCFVGAVDDIQAYYQAMDMVLMPSLHEGFPMVAVEAQAAVLPLVLSDALARDIAATPLVRYIGIGEADTNAWADAILAHVGNNIDNQTQRGDPAHIQALTEAGFSIGHAARYLNGILGVSSPR